VKAENSTDQAATSWNGLWALWYR